MQATFAHVNDRLRAVASETAEIRIYRGDDLVLRCGRRGGGAGCTPDDDGATAELTMRLAGTYRVLIFAPPAGMPGGGYDRDRAALDEAGSHPFESRFVAD
jgi:hypothetical protein